MQAYDAIRIGTLLSWAEVFAAILTMAVVVGITVFVLAVVGGIRQESHRGRGKARLPGPTDPHRTYSATLHGWVILCLLLAG
jgi:hypothetical protein